MRKFSVTAAHNVPRKKPNRRTKYATTSSQPVAGG
jgi:hypothetical protein